MAVDPHRKSRMRLSDRDKADLCFAFAAFAATYSIIALAAHGMAQGWW